MSKVTILLKDNPTAIVIQSNQTPPLVRNELTNLIRKGVTFNYTGTRSMVILHPDSIAGILVENL